LTSSFFIEDNFKTPPSSSLALVVPFNNGTIGLSQFFPSKKAIFAIV
jgi:hypothetical protein